MNNPAALIAFGWFGLGLTVGLTITICCVSRLHRRYRQYSEALMERLMKELEGR